MARMLLNRGFATVHCWVLLGLDGRISGRFGFHDDAELANESRFNGCGRVAPCHAIAQLDAEMEH